jgi:hypothetical protein
VELPDRKTSGGRAETRWPIAVAALFYLCLVAAFLLRAGGPDWFLHLGREFPPALQLARAELGEDVAVPHEVGHDGKSFWVLARDPFLTDPGSTGRHLDRPAYRAQRIAYPILASPWRAAGPWSLVWGLLITNLVIVVWGTSIAVALARALGAPTRALFAYVLCPSTVVAVLFDLSDALALAALLATLLALLRKGHLQALVAASVAVLAREVTLLSFIAIAALQRSIPWRRRLSLVLVPGGLLLAWVVYARVVLGPANGGTREMGLPFIGYLDVSRAAVEAGAWATVISALAVLALAGFTIHRWWVRRTILMDAALPYGILAILLTPAVLDVPLNSLRAIGPALTLVVIDYYSSQGEETGTVNAPERDATWLTRSGSVA